MVLCFHIMRESGIDLRVVVRPQAPYQLPGPEELKKNFKRNGTVTKALKR